jgi:hypothetical protein
VGIVTKFGSGGGTRQYSLELSAGAKASMIVADGTTSSLATGATSIGTGTWVHLAGVQDATDVYLYLNGVQDGTNATDRAMINTASVLTFGKYSTLGFPLDGRLAEVAIYNAALTAGQVATLATGVPASTVQAANLVGYWPLCGKASPEPDLITPNNATINGTVAAAAHPPGTFLCNVGAGVAGLFGAGVADSVNIDTGRGVAGLVGSGVKQFIGAITHVKAGAGKVGADGHGVGTKVTAAFTYTKTGFGKAGTTATSTSGLAQDVVFEGIVIAFGSTTLDPYPTWTRIDQ